MIIIKLIHNGTSYIAERSLTLEEEKTIILTMIDGENVIHYQQGDELPIFNEE